MWCPNVQDVKGSAGKTKNPNKWVKKTQGFWCPMVLIKVTGEAAEPTDGENSEQVVPDEVAQWVV